MALCGLARPRAVSRPASWRANRARPSRPSQGSFGPLIDPNTAPLRALPREDRDLFISAANNHLLAFDNVSGSLPPWISDAICRLSTGGGYATRQLYTDADEVLFDVTRPVILNGIDDVVTRPDLAQRSLFAKLEPIPEDKRKTEDEILTAFEAKRPVILGALLDGIRPASGARRA